MNKLNITGNTFPLTVENLQVLQSQTELIQSALLASINNVYSGVATNIFLIVDNKDNIVCAYYQKELYAVVDRGDTSKVRIVEKTFSVSTDTETFADVRKERYAVLGNNESGEKIIKTFYNSGTNKNVETINLRSLLTGKIESAQSTATSAMNKATEAANAAATAQEKANTASSVANSATTTANNASAKANTASVNSNAALENSSAALSAADTALEKANTASSTADTASSTASAAQKLAEEAKAVRTYIVKGITTGEDDDYPNKTLMGTITMNYEAEEMYLQFRCWTDKSSFDYIGIQYNNTSFPFPNFVAKYTNGGINSSDNFDVVLSVIVLI